MDVALLSNERNRAGVARAAIYNESYPEICNELIRHGFNDDLLPETRTFSPIEPLVSAEYDDEKNIQAIKASLEHHGHHVTVLDISDPHLTLKHLIDHTPDAAFNYAEGLSVLPWGLREIENVKLLEMLRIRHTGSPSHVASIIYDKMKTYEVLRNLGFKVPHTVSRCSDEYYYGPLPAFIKPRYEGSGIGIDASSIVHDKDEARLTVQRKIAENLQPVILQELVEGLEVTVALLPYDRGLHAFPPLVVKTDTPYGHEEKFGDLADNVVYGFLDDRRLAASITKTASSAYNRLGMKGFARIDFIVCEQGNYIIEVNQPAGLGFGGIDIFSTENDPKRILANVHMSDFPKAVLAASNISNRRDDDFPKIKSFSSLVNMILEHSV